MKLSFTLQRAAMSRMRSDLHIDYERSYLLIKTGNTPRGYKVGFSWATNRATSRSWSGAAIGRP